MAGHVNLGTTIEEIAKAVLGYGLGSSGADGSIDQTVRPTVVAKVGPPWLVHTHQQDKLTAGWSPGKTQGKLTFWRKMKGTHIEWVEISLAGGDSVEAPSITQPDTGASSGNLTKISDAWRGFATDVPTMTGPGKTLDPRSIADAATLLADAAQYFGEKHSQMTDMLANLDRDAADFHGSASEAFAQRVGVALVKVTGAKAKADTWTRPVNTAADSARKFGRTLYDEIEALGSKYANSAMLVPSNLVIMMLNGAHLRNSHNGDEGNAGQDLVTKGVVGTSHGGAKSLDTIHTYTPTFMLSLPETHDPTEYDVFVPASWLAIDQAIRSFWAKNMLAAFPQTAAAAKQLVTDMQAAADLLRPPKIEPNPKATPPPEPDSLNGGDGGNGALNDALNGLGQGLNNIGDGLGDGFNNLGGGLNNLGDGLGGLGSGLNGLGDGLGSGLNNLGNGLGDGFSNLGSGLNGLGDGLGAGLNGLGDGFDNLGGGLNGLGDGLGSGLNGLGNDLGGGLNGLGGGLNGLGDGLGGGLNGLGGGLNGLGDGLGGGLNGLGGDSGGGLGGGPDDLKESAAPMNSDGGLGGGLNGLGGDSGGGLGGAPDDLKESAAPMDPTGSTDPAQSLGDLTPTQQDQTPLSPADTSALDSAGLGGGLGAGLGGGLGGQTADEPATDDGKLGVGTDGLGVGADGLGSDPTGAGDTLGSLSPDQLSALQRDGALDSVPTTPAQLSELQNAGLLGPNTSGVDNLGDLSPAQLQDLSNAGLLDQTPLTQADTTALQNAGLGSGLGTGSNAGTGLDPTGPGTTGLGTTGLDTTGLGTTGLGTGTNGLGNNLGSLSPDQLSTLQHDGLLNSVPTTPAQLSELQNAGLLGPNTSGISNLGQLSPAQLQDLSSSGLLNQTPITPAQATDLGATTSPALGSLGGNPSADSLGATPPSSQFPTNVDGFDVSAPTAGSSSTLPGIPLGNVSQPISHQTLDGNAGLVGGGLGGGTGAGGVGGGLGSLHKVAGSVGGLGGSGGTATQTAALGSGLGADALGSTLSNSLGTGAAGVGATGGGVGSSQTSGGMPMMPPMGGGMGGGMGGAGGQSSRERSTWLTEDEDVWGTDPDCAPAVIGRGDDDDVSEPVDVPVVPEGPRPKPRPGRARQPGQ